MIQAERFSRLKFPVHKIEADTVAALFKAIPGLKYYFQDPDKTHLPVWGGQLLSVIKYIVFLYDENTDLSDEYPDDVRLRKDAAAKEAGFKRDGEGNWPPWIQDIMDFKDDVARGFILNYMKLNRSETFSEIKLIEEEQLAIQRTRAENIAAGIFSKKDDLLQQAKDRRQDKELLIKKFYAEHSDLKAATEDELSPVSPENVFKVMNFPRHLTHITQVNDVSENAGVNKSKN